MAESDWSKQGRRVLVGYCGKSSIDQTTMRCFTGLLALMAADALVATTRRAQNRNAAMRFTPTPLEPAQIAQELAVVAASGGAFAFWWFVTVPEKRLEVRALRTP